MEVAVVRLHVRGPQMLYQQALLHRLPVCLQLLPYVHHLRLIPATAINRSSRYCRGSCASQIRVQRTCLPQVLQSYAVHVPLPIVAPLVTKGWCLQKLWARHLYYPHTLILVPDPVLQ